MLRARPAKFILLLDQLNSWWLATVVVAITIVFALVYWQLGVQLPGHGLIQGTPQISCGFWDSIYFSIVTETTLGAGDITPQGVSRIVLCIQVFVGLALGGVIVAKVTSARGKELRLLAYRATGDWIEVCRVSDGSTGAGDGTIFTFVTIYAADETLRYDGENLSHDGDALGFFRSELIDLDNAILRFRYSNRESSTVVFTEGTASLRFIEDSEDHKRLGKWVRYQGTATDFSTGQVYTYHGVRATPEEARAIHSLDYEARLNVVRVHMNRARRVS